MYVEIIGLGHIGFLSLIHLASKGLRVRPIDKDHSKVSNILEFRFDNIEGDLKDLALGEEVRSNLLKDRPSDIEEIYYLVCVGTPTGVNGSVDLSQVEKAFDEIISQHPPHRMAKILLRSTVPAGTCESLISKYQNTNISLAYFPEFIRTGESLKDLLSPSLFVYASDGKGADALVKQFPKFEDARKLSFRTCEHLKYVSNTWHALKVAFANEMSSLATQLEVDCEELFDVFLSDKKLNVSEKYLKPGPPYGGPCLTKEVEALNFLARDNGVSVPVTEQVNNSNNVKIKSFENSLREMNPSRLYVFGVGFRPNTDDIRHSVPLKLLRSFGPEGSFIIDRSITIDGFRNSSKLPEDLAASDVVLIGSQLPNEQDYLAIKKSKCKILDLGYHKIHTEK